MLLYTLYRYTKRIDKNTRCVWQDENGSRPHTHIQIESHIDIYAYVGTHI